MKKIQFISLLLFLLAAACGEKLLELDPVLPVDFTTGSLDTTDLTITGQIISVGDGLREYGHIWSAETDNPTLDNTNSISELGTLESPGEYTSNLVLSGSNVTYFIRGYVIDVHDCVHYGEVIEYSVGEAQLPVASFTASDNECYAPCSITYTSTSSNADRWKWYIDGALVSENDFFTHTYDQPGVYEVRLWVSNGVDTASTLPRNTTILSQTFEKQFAEYSVGRKVLNFPGGGYLVAGITYVDLIESYRDIFLVRILPDGNVDENFRLEWDMKDFDDVEDLIQLSDGTFVLVGYASDQDDENEDIFFVRVNTQGAEVVTARLIGSPSDQERAYSVIETTDANLLIAGTFADESSQGTDTYLIKTSFNLDLTSIDASFPAPLREEPRSVIETTAGTFLIGGISRPLNGGASDAMLQVYDGTSLTNVAIPYNTANFDEVSALRERSAGTFVACGKVQPSPGSNDILLFLMDGDGGNLQSIQLPGMASTSEQGNDLVVLNDQSLVITGARDGDALLLKYEEECANTICWDQEFAGAGNWFFRSVVVTPDGGFAAVGSANNSLYVVKTNAFGET